MIADTDIAFMRQALREAKKGLGRTSPNPCVGAVIVNNGQVVGKGYHKKAGTPHAEVHALRDAGEKARGATLYVTLEPCSHTGRTPPCCHAVAAAGISRVVVGMTDPNPLVDGSGNSYLRQHGIEVVAGVLEQDCQAINRPFIKYITTGLPLVVMKAGVSLDGKLNYRRGESGWITGSRSVQMVHRLRDGHDAIMVGRSTAAIDNPSLNTRLGKRKGRDPVRVILDSHLALDPDSRPFSVQSTAPAWVFCATDADQRKIFRLREIGVEVFAVQSTGSGLDLREVLTILGSRQITSVLVEGGAEVHGALLRERLYDFAYLFIAPLFAGEEGVSLVSGYRADNKVAAVSLVQPTSTRLGDDILVSGQIRYPANDGRL